MLTWHGTKNHPYLHEHIDQVEHLAEDKLEDVAVVGPESPEEIVYDGGAAVAEGVDPIQHLAVQALDQHVELAAWYGERK